MEKELRAKPLVKAIYEELKDNISKAEEEIRISVIILGEDPAAEFYLNNIEKNCSKTGIGIVIKRLSTETTQDVLLHLIRELNEDPHTHAVMVQKPLPAHINDNAIAAAIKPEKDIDGFNPVNLGKLMIEAESLLPSTPAAVIEMLRFYNIELKGKHTVLCGRSHIVGKPLLNLLINKQEPGNATVTVCHSRTADLAKYTREADVLITALGQARFIKGDMIKEGVIILDVGTNEVVEGDKRYYVGDVDYEECFDKSAAITPVPGGIGSVTTALLLRNVWYAYKQQQK